jgi:hypothetical protein
MWQSLISEWATASTAVEQLDKHLDYSKESITSQLRMKDLVWRDELNHISLLLDPLRSHLARLADAIRDSVAASLESISAGRAQLRELETASVYETASVNGKVSEDLGNLSQSIAESAEVTLSAHELSKYLTLWSDVEPLQLQALDSAQSFGPTAVAELQSSTFATLAETIQNFKISTARIQRLVSELGKVLDLSHRFLTTASKSSVALDTSRAKVSELARLDVQRLNGALSGVIRDRKMQALKNIDAVVASISGLVFQAQARVSKIADR